MKILKSLFIVTIAVAGLTMASCGSKKGDDATKTEEATEQGNDVPKVVTIIDFNATWCGPCKQFAPIFEAASEKYTNVEFQSVDVDQYPDLAAEYGVESIPMVVFLNEDNEVLTSNVGFMEAAEFEAMIEKYL